MAEATAGHPTLGGKSIESVQAQQTALASSRQPYKSWRKKYRKMRVKFDAILEDNRKLFKEEQKLEGLARRLTEELEYVNAADNDAIHGTNMTLRSSLLEILLDLNQNPAISPELRFNIDYSHSQKIQDENRALLGLQIPAKLQPVQANDMMSSVVRRIQRGEANPLEREMVRQELQKTLADQDVKALAMLESKIQPSAEEISDFTRDNNPHFHPAFLMPEQEDAYLKRIDAIDLTTSRTSENLPVIHQADLPTKELERQLELMNPQSQHNWLRTHSKSNVMTAESFNTITDSLEGEYTQDTAERSAKSSSKKRNSSKNLARQIGDKAVDKVMREGYSPSSGFGDEDELGYDEVTVRRRGTSEKDPTFRSKSSKGGSTKSKRKRATDDNNGGGGAKRVRASEIFD